MDNSKRKSDGDVVRNALQFPETSVDSVFHSIVDRQLHLNINGILVFAYLFIFIIKNVWRVTKNLFFLVTSSYRPTQNMKGVKWKKKKKSFCFLIIRKTVSSQLCLSRTNSCNLVRGLVARLSLYLMSTEVEFLKVKWPLKIRMNYIMF